MTSHGIEQLQKNVAVGDDDTRTLIPDRVEIEFVDAKQRKYEAVATSVNSAPTNTWMNLHAPVFLPRWTCNGREGWGESQDVYGNDFAQAYLAR